MELVATAHRPTSETSVERSSGEQAPRIGCFEAIENVLSRLKDSDSTDTRISAVEADLYRLKNDSVYWAPELIAPRLAVFVLEITNIVNEKFGDQQTFVGAWNTFCTEWKCAISDRSDSTSE
jgi:hypothetical protein